MFGSITHICARWMGNYYRTINGTIGKDTSKPVKSIAEHWKNSSIHWTLIGKRDMAYQGENRIPDNAYEL